MWLKTKNYPVVAVRDITDDEVALIYHGQYWEPLQCDQFGKPLDLVLFDTAVNHGVTRAVKILQTALTAPADGVLGSVTLAAALGDSSEALAMDMLTARANFYSNIIANAPSQKKFANGWANRLEV